MDVPVHFDVRQVGELLAANRDRALSAIARRPLTWLEATGALTDEQRRRAYNLADKQTRGQVTDAEWNRFKSHVARKRMTVTRAARSLSKTTERVTDYDD